MTAAELSALVDRLPPWAVVLFVLVNLLSTLYGTARAGVAGARGTLAAGRWYWAGRQRRLDRQALARVGKMQPNQLPPAWVQVGLDDDFRGD